MFVLYLVPWEVQGFDTMEIYIGPVQGECKRKWKLLWRVFGRLSMIAANRVWWLNGEGRASLLDFLDFEVSCAGNHWTSTGREWPRGK